ncbi:hypothetical protein EGM70_08235 [Enterobacteriaceae bacterium 89]|nr:hypothetical protein [Enterobacteriaceae bacterium 89]
MLLNEGADRFFHSKVTTESDYFSVLMWIETYGGLSGILEKIGQHDLHHTVASWLGDGPNFAIYPEQLLSIININELELLAIECRTDLPGAALMLSSVLPILADGLSTQGKIDLPPSLDFLSTGIDLLCHR